MCQRCTDYRDAHRRPAREREPDAEWQPGKALFKAKRVELAATHPHEESEKR